MDPKRQKEKQGNRIYLCAPVNALVEGIFEENIPLSRIREHGDFGLGTFDELDGEMVILDGTVYQIGADGRVKEVGEEARTPFACVTFYRPLSHDDIISELDYRAFLDLLQGLFPSPNLFYAIRINGEFASVKTRSVPKQENYLPLVEAAKTQSVFTFREIRGTLAGFYTPQFMSSVNVPGLHLHFLSDDRKRGGHLLECRPRKGRIGVQFIETLELSLPKSLDYLTWDFGRDSGRDLNAAER